jgi:exopolysaccharide biosynthesis polyprenyl glycosylphosphotransferase
MQMSMLYAPRVLTVVLGDILCLAAAALLAWILWSPALSADLYAVSTACAALVCLVTLYYGGAYGLSVLGSAQRTLVSISAAIAMMFGAVLVIHFTVRLPADAIGAMARVAALYLLFLPAERLGLGWLLLRPRLRKRGLVIGDNDLGIAIARAMSMRRNIGVEFVGFLSDDDSPGWSEVEGFRVLGNSHETEKIVDSSNVDAIIVASNRRSTHFPADALLGAKLQGCHVESGVAFYERITGRVYLRGLRQSYLIFSDGFHIGPFSTAVKRIIDASAAAVGLLLAAPILGFCVLAIRLDSRGPVFYRQQRVGKGGRLFYVLKLRTMKDRAEEETGPVLSGSADERVTRIGRFLRRARIDEIPQLWNVLKGEMSLVGPRPERPELRDQLSDLYPYFRWRTWAKPGVTGWAQIRLGYVNDLASFDEKLGFDLYYLKHWSLLLDFFILWKTLKTVLLLRGI